MQPRAPSVERATGEKTVPTSEGKGEKTRGRKKGGAGECDRWMDPDLRNKHTRTDEREKKGEEEDAQPR